jgi:hypothetical protein
MWRRFRRRSLAPRRPAVFLEQIGIVMVTAAAIVGGVVALVLLVR